ncbi:MAG: Ig-like domain-containing protein, partial [Phycisphaerales bacterium]|nr:Ig-like domain-containing protein [Phycisphaerales bacterium]
MADVDGDGDLDVLSAFNPSHGAGGDDDRIVWFENDPNQAPTGVALANAVTSLEENTDTADRIKLADIVITDDALGTNEITFSGPDAASFTIADGPTGPELYLEAGTALDYETQSQYDVTVHVEDMAIPDSTPLSVDWTLNITDVNEAPTDLELSNTVSELPEDTDTTSRVKLADIEITDDALGTNEITLSGPDAASFAIADGPTGPELYLEAGTALDYETQSQYDVTVHVEDMAIPDSTPLSVDWTLDITDVNEAPTLDAITDLTIAEDAGTQTVDLAGITAGPGETQTLHVTAISDNTGLIPSPTVTYTSAEATGSITFTPLTDKNGTALINVFVIDAGPDGDLSLTADNTSFIRTFTVTVIPVNDPPTLAAINNQTEEENSGVHTVSLTGITAGPGDETESVRLAATSSNTSLITDPQVTYNTGEDTATLSWSSEPHQIGMATITVTVEDAGPDDDFNTPGDNLTLMRTFDITVTARSYDYGDSAASYPVTRVQDGARHDTPASVPQLWAQRGSDIDGEAEGDWPGYAVSLSADGNTVAIGAHGNDGVNGQNSGHTRIYRWNAGTADWDQLGVDIDGEATGDWSGYAVSLSADGNTVAIGAHGNDGVNGQGSGHTRIYRWHAGTATWVQLGGDIDGEATGDWSGYAVSLSADGNTVAIGAPYNDGVNGQDSGHTRIYRWYAGTADWDQLGVDIDGEATNDYSGFSVSLSADGNTVAIGTPYNDGVNGQDSGHTRIYRWNAGTADWDQLGVDIDGEAVDDRSGYAVSLSADGNTVAIGAHGNDGVNGQGSGHTRIYRWHAGTATWVQLGGDIDGEHAGGRSGWSVSLSADGNTVAIGAGYNDGVNGQDSGHTRIYRWHAGTATWVQLGVDIDGEAPYDYSGFSVSLSADGNTVAIGTPYNDGVNGQDSGHTRIYRLIDNSLRLGATRDVEPTGVPSTAADGDGDDEDGLSWPAVLVAGDTYQIPVDLQGGSGAGNLDAWIDWNQNGHWNDPGEQILDTQSVTAGVTTVSITVPGDAASGDTYARFRLSTAGGLAPTGLAADGEVEDYRVTINAAPTLDAITDLTIAEDAGLQNIDLDGITAGPGETQTLQVTAISSNPLVIPSPTVTYTSAEATGSITFTPLTDASGSATVTVTVTDAGPDGDLSLTADNATFSRTFNVTVTPVNDLPTLDAITDLTIAEDAGLQNIDLDGITAGPGETQILQVTAISSNPLVIPSPTVTYTSAEATGSITFAPLADASGSATVTVTVEDGGLDNDLETPGDNDTFSRTFDVTVNPVNDDPALDALSDLVIAEDAPTQTVDLTGVADGDQGLQPLRVTATSDNTDLIPDPAVTYTSADSAGSLTFAPVADATGTATITVTVEDGGLDLDLTTPADNATFSQSFDVTVNPVNDLPTLDALSDLVIDEDSATQTVDLTGVADGDQGLQPLRVTAT